MRGWKTGILLFAILSALFSGCGGGSGMDGDTGIDGDTFTDGDQDPDPDVECPAVTDLCHQQGSICQDNAIHRCSIARDAHGCATGETFDDPSPVDCGTKECVKRWTGPGDPVWEAACVTGPGIPDGLPGCGGLMGGACPEGSFCYIGVGGECGVWDVGGRCLADTFTCSDPDPRPLSSFGGSADDKMYLVNFYNECQVILARACVFGDRPWGYPRSCQSDEECPSYSATEWFLTACVDGICEVASCSDMSCPNYRPCPSATHVCRELHPSLPCESVCAPRPDGGEDGDGEGTEQDDEDSSVTLEGPLIAMIQTGLGRDGHFRWTKEFTTCNARGLWEMTMIDTVCGIVWSPETGAEFGFQIICRFRLPRDPLGELVSGTARCIGEQNICSEYHQPVEYSVVFDREAMTIDGIPLQTAHYEYCTADPDAARLPCVLDVECGPGEVCTWEHGCRPGCLPGGCGTRGTCNPDTGHCGECTPSCTSPHVCVVGEDGWACGLPCIPPCPEGMACHDDGACR